MKNYSVILTLLSVVSCAKPALHWVHEKSFSKNIFLPLTTKEFQSTHLETDGDKLYFGSSSGVFYGVSGKTGKKKWSVSLQGSVDASPLVVGKNIYVGTHKGFIYQVDSVTGKATELKTTQGEVIGQMAYANGILLFGTHLDQLYALDIQTKEILWKYKKDASDKMKMRIFPKPIVVGDKVLAGFFDGAIVALNFKTGQREWEQLWSDSEKFSDIAWLGEFDDRTFLAGKSNGQIAIFRLSDGLLELQFSSDSGSNPPLRTPQGMVTPGQNGKVSMLNPLTGEILWAYTPNKPMRWSGLCEFKHGILIASFDGKLHHISPKDGSLLWIYDVESPISGDPKVVGNKVWVLTQKGELMSFKF